MSRAFSAASQSVFGRETTQVSRGELSGHRPRDSYSLPAVGHPAPRFLPCLSVPVTRLNWRGTGPAHLDLQISPLQPCACLLRSCQAFGSCLSSRLLWAPHPEVFFDPNWDLCAPHEVGSQMAPLKEGRQKKAKPGLAKRPVSLHRPPDSGKNGLTHPKELH